MYARIRNLREDADITQAELARILNCSQRVYSNYERGDLDIPTEILIKLATYHNVSVDYILGRTDKKRNEQIKNAAYTKRRFNYYIQNL